MANIPMPGIFENFSMIAPRCKANHSRAQQRFTLNRRAVAKACDSPFNFKADSCTSMQYLLEPFHSADVLNHMRQPIWKAESLHPEPIVLAALKCEGVRVSRLSYN